MNQIIEKGVLYKEVMFVGFMFTKKNLVSPPLDVCEKSVRDSFAFCAGYQEIINGGGCY